MQNNGVKATVVCFAYNHEKYIRQTLEGFVNQKTSFAYEVVIHDDASTDSTADIIREYEEKYPHIIKPIYQTVNQYSLKVNTYQFILPLMKGDYVAMCEGDDYWVDEDKLQKQVDALDANPDCSVCLHKVKTISDDGKAKTYTYPPFEAESGIIPSEKFIPSVITAYIYQTSCFMFRGDLFREYVSDYPEFRRVAGVGDVPYLLYFGNLGNVYYIDEAMSRYRISSAGSWTERNRDKGAAHIKRMNLMIEAYDKYTDGKYHDSCLERLRYNEMHACFLEKRFKDVLNKKYRDLFKKETFKFKTATYIGRYFYKLYPFIYKMYSRIKHGAK